MLKIIRSILQKFIDDIDANNTNLSYEQQCNLIRVLSNVDSGQDNEMNKTQAADYLGVSRATFDNYIKDGFIPKGKQIGHFKELRWYKSDLDLFLIN
ncbi:MAG: helix-turn-helix domain-containing protein [Bacilli bacterium]|nr:helix-turn-helix domain-containing protein [Bacilli bacterium]